MELSFFNPQAQKEADFLANFVARQRNLEHFLQQLRNTDSHVTARHFLVVAPRGYGKTSLLRRVAIAIRQEQDFKKRFIALGFREEQHNVISLDVFWRNCIESLLETRELEGATETELDALNTLWEQHAPRSKLKLEQQDGEFAWHDFSQRCQQLGRRPVLLIDNLDSMLAGLSSQHQWGLRRILQASDGPILLAAASRYPDSLSDQAAAFYDFFRIQTLEKLSDDEVLLCLKAIANHRGEQGQKVQQLLDFEPGRVGALNTMAGGNPRTLSVLYSVLEADMSADIMSQLSAMLDTFTGWYQARTEELALQSRAVFDALALNWDPMTAAALAAATGLDVQTVSSQMTRLEKAGYAEAVALSSGNGKNGKSKSKGRNGYQVSERFYNIWYLMRNGQRRAKQAIQFLTVFLEACFKPQERLSMARKLLNHPCAEPAYALALASSIGGSKLRRQLINLVASHRDVSQLSDEYQAIVNTLNEEISKKNEANILKMYSKSLNQIENKEYESAKKTLLKTTVNKGSLSITQFLFVLLYVTKYNYQKLKKEYFGELIYNNPNNLFVFFSNIAAVIAIYDYGLNEAQDYAAKALKNYTEDLSQVGKTLLLALPKPDETLFVRCERIWQQVKLAVTQQASDLWGDHLDDLQRLLWYVIHHGQGPAFKANMIEAQFPLRYAPLYHAFVAALEGEDHLLKINPETRKPAQHIYEGLAHRLKIYAEQN